MASAESSATQAVPAVEREAQEHATGTVAIDDEVEDDDSAYISELESLTTTLPFEVRDYKFHNGRRYHAYKEGRYIFPNDEKESERLDILHKVVELVMNNKLYFAQLQNPRRVLDIGTGTGLWAMEFGDQHPSADVVGTDLSPIQPTWVPPNVHFEVDDAEAPWTFSQKFDFVHCRSMNNAIHDWPSLVNQTFENLTPGGYAEFVDWDVTWVSPDDSIPKDGVIWKVNREFLRAVREAGAADPTPGPKLEGWFKNAGFVDIQCTCFPVPFGTWPADPRLKEIGAWNFLQLMEGLEGMIYVVFTKLLNLEKKEVDVLAAKFRQDFKNPRIHPMCHLYVCVGKKPQNGIKEEF